MMEIYKTRRLTLLVLVLIISGMVLGGCGKYISKADSFTWEELNKDPLFAQPYIDVDEWRDSPVRHRYVHGGFKDTDTRFSFYFPEKEHYQGRFYQYITPAPDNENLAQGGLQEKRIKSVFHSPVEPTL